MNHIISNLLMYNDAAIEGSILANLAEIHRELEEGTTSIDELRTRTYNEVKRILEVATKYGFNDNLWHNYLTFLLITSENPFSLTCEKTGASEGTVNHFVENDFDSFKKLFDYDFTDMEAKLGIDCFSMLPDYHSIEKKDFMYNQNVSQKVRALSKELEATQNKKEFFDAVTNFYKQYGVGMFGLNKAFRILEENGKVNIIPINNMDKVMLNDLVGYEHQKQELVDNTKAFVEGRKANNALLYGDSGTGKSTSIKAIVNEFYEDGLRMIEIYKHQFKDLSNIIGQIKNRNYKFIIYMDDLSFEEFEIEYKFLKAVIEGGVETRPENILIYATSNRRHLIRETWNDKNDVDQNSELHRNDTIEEKLSLSNRFGVKIFYGKPNRVEYHNIVRELVNKAGIEISDEELKLQANQWELRNGGVSGRTAEQFVKHLQSINTK